MVGDAIIFLLSILFFIVIYCDGACNNFVHQSKVAYLSPSSLISGACGYGSMGLNGYYGVAGSPRLYRSGVGCGSCFQIRCKHPRFCHSGGIKVVLTDLNKTNNETDFSIDGRALMAMAQNETSNELMKVNSIDVEYKRIPCEYENRNLSIRVEKKSKKAKQLTIKFLYQGGQTNIVAVDVAKVGSVNWQFMSRDYGPVWSTNRVPTGPLKFRMVVDSGYGGKWVLAQQRVLPAQWKVGSVYDLGVQIVDVAKESCDH